MGGTLVRAWPVESQAREKMGVCCVDRGGSGSSSLVLKEK